MSLGSLVAARGPAACPPRRLLCGERVLFVYGTLLAGQANHHELQGARLLARAFTAPGYGLVDLGDWPGLVRQRVGRVLGEVYAVNEAQLAWLDAFEECPKVYLRRPIALACATPAEAYFLQRCVAATRPPLRPAYWPLHASRSRAVLG